MATLRNPIDGDAPALSALMEELGYPMTPEQVLTRLHALESHPGAEAFVAELRGRVVGYVQCHVFPSLHLTTPAAWLTALVVAKEARGTGIGQQLVVRAEQFVKERGAARLSLSSGLHRSEAHGFYEALGYTRTGVRLTKVFDPRVP
jgi:GNAT superfamily N-acetyltransferase